MSRSTVNSVLIIIIPIVILVAAGIILADIGAITTEKQTSSNEQIDVTLIIDYGNNQVDTYQIQTKNVTVYAVLMQAAERYQFPVNATYHDAYQSHYISMINSVEEGKNYSYWQYYINGEYGIVGADHQIINNDDVIEWKFKKPNI